MWSLQRHRRPGDHRLFGAGYAAAAISPSTRRASCRAVSGDQGDPCLPIEQSPYLLRRSGTGSPAIQRVTPPNAESTSLPTWPSPSKSTASKSGVVSAYYPASHRSFSPGQFGLQRTSPAPNQQRGERDRQATGRHGCCPASESRQKVADPLIRRYRLSAAVCVPMLPRCSWSARQRLRRSAPPSTGAASC
jgi:hypothetical protein